LWIGFAELAFGSVVECGLKNNTTGLLNQYFIVMNIRTILKSFVLSVLICLLSGIFLFGQKKNMEGYLGKADLYKAKESALAYLSDGSVIQKFGIISDSIWSFAELGMQEFRSSALLIKTLETEGFKVEKGVAGMPTCFVATWGSGKPVIGILGEFDAVIDNHSSSNFATSYGVDGNAVLSVVFTFKGKYRSLMMNLDNDI
jgi:hypothetical protein